MTVYEMTLGKHPYPSTNAPIELLEMIRSLPSPSLAGIPGLSLELIDFVNKW